MLCVCAVHKLLLLPRVARAQTTLPCCQDGLEGGPGIHFTLTVHVMFGSYNCMGSRCSCLAAGSPRHLPVASSKASHPARAPPSSPGCLPASRATEDLVHFAHIYFTPQTSVKYEQRFVYAIEPKSRGSNPAAVAKWAGNQMPHPFLLADDVCILQASASVMLRNRLASTCPTVARRVFAAPAR